MQGKKIFDEFTNIFSGARRYVLRCRARRLCAVCGRFADAYLCTSCKIKANINAKHFRVRRATLESLGK